MKKWIALLCIFPLFLSGCARKPIETLPPAPTTETAAETEPQEVFSPQAQLQADLSVLTQNPRPLGSEGEATAVRYLTERFEAMGYSVTLQPYTGENGLTGSNVIAVGDGSATGDILVISTHHDSFPTAYGANDNASGVAALLLAAEQLRDMEADTELRFISFTDEENGKNGSRQYVQSLSPEERQRIVGCIQLDMLGGLGSQGTMVCTTGGSPNWLSDLLFAQDSALTLGTEAASDHAIFQLAGIPSVLVTQNGRGYLYHSVGDTADSLNLSAIQDAAEDVVAAVTYIASPDTPSYQGLAQEQAGNGFYRQTRQSRIFFSGSREENEAYLGLSGTLVDSWEETGPSWSDTYEVYQYNMGWFGGEAPMATHYIYRNGFLQNVEIHPSQNGYTTQQLCTLITETHGTPRSADETTSRWEWQDELYSKYISLYEEDGVPVVSVGSYSVGISNTLATYGVDSGEAVIEDPRHRQVWDLLCTAIPLEYRQKIGQFQLFTDGFGNILAYTAPMEGDGHSDNTRFCITVDYYDVFDENGTPRDWSNVLYTLIHEYGHVLLEDDTQIDLTAGSDTHDPAGFIRGSFRQRFYDAFWQDPFHSFLGTYEEKPENYVSRYGANAFHEDIADTFAVFVFGSKPEGQSIAEQKLRFFWADSKMVALRAEIRSGLGLN